MKVSGKGQIVIPSKLRERLHIEPGMEVNFRIRGQILIVEIDTDVNENIEYLNGIDLQGESLDEGSIRDIVKDLIYQQFYDGDNIITDRIGSRKIKIRGAESIISEVINILTHSSRHWINGDPVESIREFATDFELDFPTLIQRFTDKIRNMMIGGPQLIQMMGAEVIYALAIGEAISQFRTRIGDIVTEILFKLSRELGYVDKLGYEHVEDLITRSLADKYSILMNLKVLKEFAKVNLKKVGQRMFDNFSDEMLQSYSDEEAPDYEIKRRERREKRRSKKKGKKTSKSKILKPQTVSDEEDEVPELPNFDF